jgi:hypothetical protein
MVLYQWKIPRKPMEPLYFNAQKTTRNTGYSKIVPFINPMCMLVAETPPSGQIWANYVCLHFDNATA